MDTIFAGLGKVILITVFVAIVYVAGSIGWASLQSIMDTLKTGKGTKWEDRKDMLFSIGVDFGLMIIMPFLFLLALSVTIDLAAPEVGTTTDTIVGMLEDMIVEIGNPVGTSYSDKVVESQGGGAPVQQTPYPTPYVYPTQQPEVIYVEVTPVPTVAIRVPESVATPTIMRTFP